MTSPYLPTQPLPNDELGKPMGCLMRNVGGVDIEPWSPVEIVDVYETAVSDPPPINGQLVLNVRQPTDALITMLGSTGAVKIPANKQGPGFYGSVLPLKQNTGFGHQARATVGSFSLTAGTGSLAQATVGRTLNLFHNDPVQPVRGFITTATMTGGQAAGNITDPTTLVVLRSGETLYDPYGYYEGQPAGVQGFCVFCHNKWLTLGGAATPKCDWIQFELLGIIGEHECGKMGLVEIKIRPCGCETVPGESDNQLIVYDWMGCHFDEENDGDLEGRRGSAQYGLLVEGDVISSSTSGECSDECKWYVSGLCCPTGL
jgi:hypothetical protein